MYGPRRYVDFKGRCQFDETRGLSFGASYMKEQYGSFSEGDPTAMSASARDDMTEWYDNNRQSYFVKYDGYHSKNDYEFQNDYNRLGKESRKRRPASGGTLTTASTKHTLLKQRIPIMSMSIIP